MNHGNNSTLLLCLDMSLCTVGYKGTGNVTFIQWICYIYAINFFGTLVSRFHIICTIKGHFNVYIAYGLSVYIGYVPSTDVYGFYKDTQVKMMQL